MVVIFLIFLFQTDYDSENTEKEENLTDSNQDNSECTTPTASHDHLLVELAYDPVPLSDPTDEVVSQPITSDISKTPTNDLLQDPLVKEIEDIQIEEAKEAAGRDNAAVDTPIQDIPNVVEPILDVSQPTESVTDGCLIVPNQSVSDDSQTKHLAEERNSSHNAQSSEAVIQPTSEVDKLEIEAKVDVSSVPKDLPKVERQTSVDKDAPMKTDNGKLDVKKIHKEPVRKISRFLVSPVTGDKINKPDRPSTPKKEIKIPDKLPANETKDVVGDNVTTYSEAVKMPEVKKYSKFKVKKVSEEELQRPHAKMNGVQESMPNISQAVDYPIKRDPIVSSMSMDINYSNLPQTVESPAQNNLYHPEPVRRPTPTLTPQASQMMSMANQIPQAAIQNYLAQQSVNYQMVNQMAELQPNYMAPLQVSISNQLGQYGNQSVSQLGLNNQRTALNLSTNQLMAGGLNMVGADQGLALQNPMMTNENLSMMLLQQNLRG